MSISKSCDPVNQLWYYDLRQNGFKITADLPFVKLIDNFDAKYSVTIYLTYTMQFIIYIKVDFLSFC